MVIPLRIVTVKIPESYIEAIDELVRIGRYTSRSEVIRAAIRELLKKELWSSGNRVIEGKSNKSRVIEVIEDF
ncbi:MAG: ribbon-helix-helix domain-containing protein [Ignisphaera sp.]|uniref:Ribbon-helix-helix protein, CopG family n=1 Tax=Ignisphaera aggregans TaxID=334771 RepID=A0A7C4D143_9CREN